MKISYSSASSKSIFLSRDSCHEQLCLNFVTWVSLTPRFFVTELRNQLREAGFVSWKIRKWWSCSGSYSTAMECFILHFLGHCGRQESCLIQSLAHSWSSKGIQSSIHEEDCGHCETIPSKARNVASHLIEFDQLFSKADKVVAGLFASLKVLNHMIC